MVVDLTSDEMQKFVDEMSASHEAFVADQREVRRLFASREEAVQRFIRSKLEELRGRDDDSGSEVDDGETATS